MEPIDSLQTLFNAWLETVVGVEESSLPTEFEVYPNPATDQVSVGQSDGWTVGQLEAGAEMNLTIVISNILGEKIYQAAVSEKRLWKMNIDLEMYQSGIYFVSAFDKSVLIQTQKLIIVK